MVPTQPGDQTYTWRRTCTRPSRGVLGSYVIHAEDLNILWLWKDRKSTSALEKERVNENGARTGIHLRTRKEICSGKENKYTGFLKAQKWFSSYIFFLKTCIFVLPRCVSRWVTGTNPLVSRSGQLRYFRCQYTETSYVIQNVQLVMPIRTKCIFWCSNNGRVCWYIFSYCD